jgi:hypothetical protein
LNRKSQSSGQVLYPMISGKHVIIVTKARAMWKEQNRLYRKL